MAAQYEVHLVTSDKDFYEKRDFSQGLATELRDHAAKLSRPILLHRTVEDCVKCLEEAVPVTNEGDLAKKINAYVEPELKKSATEPNFELGPMATFSVKSFPTDKPTALAISYALTYELTDRTSHHNVLLQPLRFMATVRWIQLRKRFRTCDRIVKPTPG